MVCDRTEMKCKRSDKSVIIKYLRTFLCSGKQEKNMSCVFHMFHAKIVAKQNHLTCSGAGHAFLKHLLKTEDGHILL